MPSEWPLDWGSAKLRDLGEVNRGKSKHRPRWADHLYGGPYPFIQTGDVKASNGRITSFGQTYSQGGLQQSRLWPAGTMCITIAANIAETGILSFAACFPDSVVGFIADDSKCSVYFVEYVFRHIRRRVQREATGSVQDNINLQTLDRLELPLPPLDEQRRIAAVLGALDDRIELNRKMNRTLEEMAQAIFKSWFIDFDGHDPADMVDSELGPIPRGWSVGTVSDVAAQIAMGPFGSDIKVSTFVPEGVPVISGKHLRGLLLTDQDFDFVAEEHADRLSRSNVTQGDVVFTHAGTIGQVALVPEGASYLRYILSQRQFYLRCDRRSMEPEYILHFFKSAPGQHSLLANTSTTGVPSISRPVSNLKSTKFILPALEEVRRFAAVARALHSRMTATTQGTLTLAALRDALLPKLISGEIRVPEAEAVVEEVMS